MADLVALLIQRNTTAMEMQIQLTKLKAIQQKHEALVQQVQDACDHPEHHREQTSQYYSGGYDYCSYTSYQIHCKQCGKMIADWGGEPGGFA